MAKQNGLGFRFLVGGYDLSGDISALDSITGTIGMLPGTDITQSAMARIIGLRDGSIGFTAYMDPANAHPVLAALPTADTLMSANPPPQAIGNAAAALVAKQTNYDATRGNDGSLLMKVQGQGNAYALEWGVQLTPGLRTDATATNGTSLDGGAGFSTPSVPASTTPVTNTSPLPATVVVTGGTVSNVSVNGVTAGTGDGTYVVPSGQTIAVTYSAAPTWTWTLGSASGAQAYLQVTGFTGTSVTATVQQSADNSTWITLAAFNAVTAAPAWQRVTTAAPQTFTATNASPAVFTVPGSAPANGTPVALSGPGLPGGFTAGVTYYVVSSSGSTFQLALTSGGSALNSTQGGGGTVTPAVLRYLRVITTGTFSSATFAAMVNRNLTAASF